MHSNGDAEVPGHAKQDARTPQSRALVLLQEPGVRPRPAGATKQAPTSHHLGVVWLEKQALLEIQIQER